jgi:hypothetical protein
MIWKAPLIGNLQRSMIFHCSFYGSTQHQIQEFKQQISIKKGYLNANLTHPDRYATLGCISSDGNRKIEGENRTGKQVTS